MLSVGVQVSGISHRLKGAVDALKTSYHWFAARPAACALLAFVFVGYLDFSSSFRRSIATGFGGDMTMILTRAIADLRPGMFANDFVFSDPQNYTFYTNATAYFFKLADLMRGGGIGLEYHVFGALVTFLFLYGWYRLFLEVSQSHWWSTMFSLAAAVAVPMILGDYWGLYNEPQPRVQFSALLPFLLLAGIRAQAQLRWWLLTFAAAGYGMWVHPASAPPVALSLMLAMGATALHFVSAWRVIGLCLVSGLLFLAIALPNMWFYYEGVSQAALGADAEVVREALLMRYDLGYSDPVQGIWVLMSRALSGPRCLLLVPFLAGVWLAVYRRDAAVLFVVMFGAGLAAFGGGIPIFESYIAQWSGRAPSQLDLIRSLRYMIPVLLLVSFWICMVQSEAAKLRPVLPLLLTATWFSTAHWAPTWPQSRSVAQGLKCLVNLELICETVTNHPLDKVIEFAKSTPPGTIFFSPDQGPRIRAFAERPLSFGWKDMGWLAYSNHRVFAEMKDRLAELKSLNAAASGPRTTLAWIEFGRATGAKFVVLKDAQAPTLPVKIAMTAGAYTVYQVSGSE